MGNDQFNNICMWIADYDVKAAELKRQNFTDKYIECSPIFTPRTYTDCLNSIKSSYSIAKERSDMENEFLRIWNRIIEYDLCAMGKSQPGLLQQDFYTIYNQMSSCLLQEAIKSARHQDIINAREAETKAEKVFVAARKKRIEAELKCLVV
jgi:hypothetical protein